jgi:mannose-6-phosphate isomerase-like protein (cupin superfamily)
MDWRVWMEQRVPATEIQRGGATVWPKGGRGLIGDSLGPVMHLHDDASEIFYFVAGRCRLEIGTSEEFFEAGDFVLVPPEVPHNLWNAGDDDLLVFWIVAPNFVTNKWRTTAFPSGAMDRRARRSRAAPGTGLPGDPNIRTTLLTLRHPTRHVGRTGERQETIVYVTGGPADVRVGRLGARLGTHEFVHVPVGTQYSVAPAEDPATVLLFEMPGP